MCKSCVRWTRGMGRVEVLRTTEKRSWTIIPLCGSPTHPFRLTHRTSSRTVRLLSHARHGKHSSGSRPHGEADRPVPADALRRDQRNKRKIPPHSVGHILLPPKSSQWPRFIVAALGTFSTFTQCPYTRHGKDHSGSACDNVRARPLKLTPSFAFK